MSTDDSVNDARSENWDPLTAPVWDLSDVDEPTLAPPIEQFMPVDEDTIIRRRPPLPPDADEIIRGEYTGWVPLIKSGETLDQAKAREENRVSSFETAIPNVDANAWAPIEVVASDESEFVAPDDLASDAPVTVREPVIEVRPYAFPSEIVPDPDFVVSPAEALEEARRRIAQMRASLQTNINRVSQSFDHPIFAPIEVSVQEAPPFIPVTQTEVPAAAVFEEPKSFDSLFETDAVVEPPAPQPNFAPSSATYQESVRTETREEPRVYTQSTQQASPTIIIDEAAEQTHSLELVIMRDEIKDLRDRLDSSQKLIETLMVRLADLAELALKRKD
ncbi:MAG: hypothetical protein F2627_04640 [Actinobacteria bacterium]|uniref:Unannotated protein n=1 Tax=freshwater metagenome TaxID=449393 RepID=A0A6J6L062_9ZZZZ|nr:hypothetical protein [Actinomycetota bacterium]